MKSWKVKKLKWKIKPGIVLAGVLMLKVAEMVVFQRVLHMYQDIPVNNKEELIDIIVLLLIMSPFTIIVMRQKKTMQEAEERYKGFTEDSLVGIFSYEDARITYVNSRFLQILGYKREDVIGRDFHDLIVPEDHDLVAQSIMSKLHNHEEFSVLQIRAIRKDNRIIEVELYSTILIRDGRPVISGSIMDISERVCRERTLQKLAFYDQLTGLPNRKSFEDRLLEVSHGKGTETARFALLFIDLDGFKQANDTYGHLAGDLLLKEVATRLLNCTREEDLVSRYAGDEFLILLSKGDRTLAMEVAERIAGAINTPFIINGNEIVISASIGISLYPEDGKETSILIKNADTAMYQAKGAGKNTYQFH